MSITLTIERGAAHAPGRVSRWIRSGARAVGRVAVQAARPHRKALTNLAHMPMFILGGASVDFAAFHWTHGFGWLITGVSLIIAELVAADE